MKKQLLLLVFTAMISFAWSQSDAGLKIAFYHSDSLNAGYTFLKEQDVQLTARKEKLEKELADRQADLQKKYDALMLAQQNMLYSAPEMRQKQEEFERLRTELETYQKTEGGKLQQDAIDMQMLLQLRVTEFARKFCEQKNIDVLQMYAPGGQFSYFNPKLDVTKEFVLFVNAEQSKLGK